MKKILLISFFLYLSVLIFITLDAQYTRSSKKEDGHIIDYKYTNIDGQAYKRAYDFTSNQWLSEWEKL